MMKRITILISDVSKSGGTERAAINLANLLVDNYDVEIISLHNKQSIITTFYQLNGKIRLLNLKLSVKSTIVNTISNYKILNRYFTRNKVDYIIGTWYGVNILLPFFKNQGIKVIACEHADFETTPSIVKKIAKLLYPKLDALVMLSNTAKQKVQNYSKNVIVIPNSLSFETKSIANQLSNRILMLGRLVPIKGYERVVPLALHLQKYYPDWKIDIFGDGELKNTLQNHFRDEGIKNVTIYDPVKDIEILYLNSSIYLSTSYNEAMPMVFLEAMNCGLPVLSYKNEGALCLINHNENGILVNNSNELVKQCTILIEKINLRKELGKKGKQKSLLYTESNIKNKWINLLDNL